MRQLALVLATIIGVIAASLATRAHVVDAAAGRLILPNMRRHMQIAFIAGFLGWLFIIGPMVVHP